MSLTRCPLCGCEEIVPNVDVVTYAYRSGMTNLTVRVHRQPVAMIFKRPQYGHLRAWICHSCGCAALFASNPEDLYQAHLAAQPVRDEADSEEIRLRQIHHMDES
jgi:hypothetical protein